jgi:uncharacterized protein
MNMRRDIEFVSEGTVCSGWLYLPDGAGSADGAGLPGVVMAHGFTGVKEMDLDPFARAFADSGLATLLFDYRYCGTSGGEPRQQILPAAQIDDYRSALSWLGTQPEVDPNRLGVWGTSYSGGHVLHLGAFDPRVRAVVSQIPMIDGWETGLRVVGAEMFAVLRETLALSRQARYPDKPDSYLPVVSEDGGPSAIPQSGTREHLLSLAESAPSWRNELTLGSLEALIEYAPGNVIERVSPVPLLMIVASGDVLTPPDLALAAYERAREPKQLLLLNPKQHHGVYAEPLRSQAVESAVAWFGRHL